MNKKQIIGFLICMVIIIPFIMFNCNTKSKITTANKSEINNTKSNENKGDNTANSSKTAENSSKAGADGKVNDKMSNENAVSKNQKKDLTLIGTKINNKGNTNGNLSNSGSAAEQGNWMFYTNEYTSASSFIYRSMLDGETGLKKLKLATPTSINVVNDTIYFASKNYGSIYKLDVAGSGEPVVVSNVSTSSICVIDNWIYYVEPKSDAYRTSENQGGIFKMKIDGSGRTNIVRGDIRMINLEDDFIYYLKNDNGLFNIYRANLKENNTNETKISNSNVTSFIADKDYIYYSIPGDGLYKMNTDGANKTKLVSNKDIISFNIKDNFIYYTSFMEPSVIKKITTDGKNASDIIIYALGDEKVSFISYLNIIGDYIFFNYSTNSKSEFAKAKLDGTFSKIIK